MTRMRRNRVNEGGMHLESFSRQFPGDKVYIGTCKGCNRDKQLHPSRDGVDYCNDCKRRKQSSNPVPEQPSNPYKRTFVIYETRREMKTRISKLRRAQLKEKQEGKISVQKNQTK